MYFYGIHVKQFCIDEFPCLNKVFSLSLSLFQRDGAHMKRFFREVYMDSVFPIIHSAEIPSYIWGNDEREAVSVRTSVVMVSVVCGWCFVC